MKTQKTKVKPVQTYIVFAQLWLESERGWGQRPDGTTLHLSVEDAKTYIDNYNKTHNTAATAPDEYTRATGEPFTVQVDKKVYAELEKSKNYGIWYEAVSWVKPGQVLAFKE